MFFPAQNANISTGSFLPRAFEQALLQVNRSDGFSDAVSFAAEQAGCEFLFEVPGSLFHQNGGRAAVIRSCSDLDNSPCILYIIFDGEDGVIRILEEFEVPGSVQAMTHSYSNVLELMANISPSSTPPLH